MAHEFKVGDKVRVIDHRPSDANEAPSWVDNMDERFGTEGTVIMVNESGTTVVNFPDGDCWSYKPSWLIPIESDNKPQFKPGDRVRLKPREWFDRQPTSAWREGNVCIEEHSYKETLCGKELTINRYDKSDNTYQANGYWWKAEWIRSLPRSVKPVKGDRDVYRRIIIQHALPTTTPNHLQTPAHEHKQVTNHHKIRLTMEKKKTMKRIEAIIKGRKFTEKLFGFLKRKINRAVEAAEDNVERQKEDAAIAYEGLFSRMAEDGANYEAIIKEMLEHKQTIISAEATIKAIAEIRADLEAEVTVDDSED